MSEALTVGVTGAAGYIGSRVTALLLDAGHDVVPVDNFFEPKVESVSGTAIVEGDVRDRDAMRVAFDGVDAILHLAAVTGVPDCDEHPELAFDVNVGGTENVAWVCREGGIPLVFPCSMAVVGDPVQFPIAADHPRAPLNHYGLTKAMSESDVHALAEGAFPAHVFLKSNLYGHHELDGEVVGKPTVINVFVERALDGEPLAVHRPGTQARDFVHVKDVARAYVRSLDRLLDAPDGAVTFPVAGGDCRSVLDIADTVGRIVEEERGYRPTIDLVENPRGEETVADNFSVDTSAARERIDFEARYTIEETVRDMVNS